MGRRAGLPRVYLDDDHGQVYQYSFTAHGKRQRGSTGRRDHGQAVTEAQRLYAAALLGRKPEPNVTRHSRQAAHSLTRTFAEFIASLESKKSPSYVAKLESHYRAHFAHRWQSLDELLKPGAIDAYASDRLNGRAPAIEHKKRRPRPVRASSVTVHKELVTLRRFLKWCRARNLISDLPAFDSVKPVSDFAQPQYTPDQARDLLAAVPDRHGHRRGYPAREFFTVQWAQAMRPGEVCSLRWLDVDFDLGHVHIRASEDKARVGRTIGLDVDARAVLEGLRAERSPLPSALIFGDCNYRRSLEAAAESLGLPRPTRHTLRHMRLTELGHLPKAPPASLQFLAGHKHMATTDRYVKSSTRATVDLLASAPSISSRSVAEKKDPRRKELPDSATSRDATTRNRKNG